MRRTWFLACLIFVGCGAVERSARGGLAEPAVREKREIPGLSAEARLGANLYLQTSAEYRACCLQIYRCAALRLESILESGRPKPSRPAVVMDLDETVFDNSGFQTFLYRSGRLYSDSLWSVYEEKHSRDVSLVPGARVFIERAEALGVTVIFVSNRMEEFRESTEAALTRLGLGGKDLSERLYLKPRAGSSDKTSQREAAAGRYEILLSVGDNLRDFSESFAATTPAEKDASGYVAAIERRKLLVDEAASRWGIDWFVLPNPVYGEWEKLVGPDPGAVLRPTTME